MNIAGFVHALLGLILAPLLPGIISRTKAIVAGRKGPPLLQLYYDLSKLLRKGAVYSRTTTWLIVAGPIVGLSAAIVALFMVPLAGRPGCLSFTGDLILFAYLLGLMRFATVLAALDTGSSFEGMGASREVFFSALTEPALLLGLAALAIPAHSLSLGAIYANPSATGPALIFVLVAFGYVFLAENARIPVDDPNTHLELTMIHEVMILDHGGPDLALIQYGAALKLWVLGSLIVGFFPSNLGAALGGMAALAVVTGLIESSMARLKLMRVPVLLVWASAFSILALVLVMLR